MLVEQKLGGLIQDIHDGSLIDDWLNHHLGAAKSIYCTVIGLALLTLTISGWYLWYKPLMVRKARKQ